MSYPVFISRADEDDEISRKIQKSLKQYGLEGIIAKDVLLAGDHMYEGIRSLILGSKALIVVYTHNGLKSPIVNQEVGIAFGAGTRTAVVGGEPRPVPKIPIIPFFEKGTVFKVGIHVSRRPAPFFEKVVVTNDAGICTKGYLTQIRFNKNNLKDKINDCVEATKKQIQKTLEPVGETEQPPFKTSEI